MWADFLPLLESSPMVADRDLVNISGFVSGNGQNFGMLVPARALKRAGGHQIAAEQHVATVDVGECGVIENVKKQGDQPVAQLVPKVCDTGEFRRRKPAAHD